MQWLYTLPHVILVRRLTGANRQWHTFAGTLLACGWFKCTDCKVSAFLDPHRRCWAQFKYKHAGASIYYHLLQLSRIGCLCEITQQNRTEDVAKKAEKNKQKDGITFNHVAGVFG